MAKPEDDGAWLEIDPERLDRGGHHLQGKIEAVEFFITLFSSIHEKSKSKSERRTLVNVVEILTEDAERLKNELAEHVTEHGGGRVLTIAPGKH